MNTASKNSECEVDEDFPFFPKRSNRLHVKHYRKAAWCLIGRKGEGITILCCGLPYCCTRKVVQAEKRSFLAHIITYLQNEKERRISILSYHLTNSPTGALQNLISLC